MKDILWPQLAAAIDMLGSAIDACPEELWSDRARHPEFWYVAFHALFFLDLYDHGTRDGFAPPAPFTLSELDPAGVLPERTYTKDELRTYLRYCREKCRASLEALTDEKAARLCRFRWEMTYAELVIYNLRHVQHHAGQLHLILRQETGATPGWITRA